MKWLILSCDKLNGFIQNHHFKMEETGMLRDLPQVSDWMCSINLKDTYLSMSNINSTFTSTGRGPCTSSPAYPSDSAPRVLTKLMKPVMAFLWEQGLRIIIYQDDLLIINQSLVMLHPK